jgi:hypothetical protein
MIVYNVTVKVELESAEAWVAWMRNEHLADVLSTGLFTKATLCRLLEQDESDGITYSAQYVCKNIDDYNAYIEHHAPTMREKSMAKFKDKFVAFRSIMEILAQA